MRIPRRALGILLTGLTACSGALTLPAVAAADAPGAESAADLGADPLTDPAPPGEAGEDSSLHVDDGGAIYAVDVWHQAAETAGTGAEDAEVAHAEALASYGLGDTFSLHSRPGSPRTVYLDFDGGYVNPNSRWSSVAGWTYTGWTVDGSASFSDAEKQIIQEVWARVAEDFAPFDVDVTTQPPPKGGLFRSSYSDDEYGTRVSFTNQASVQKAVCGGSCGGVAYVGTFDSVTMGEVYTPAWVFPKSLGTSNAKRLAEAASHEVGHNLGLDHDGLTTSSYYAGTSLWGPIMGSPYESQVTQWSRGDYAGANNQEDDFAVITRNGVTLRPDEAGGSAAAAEPISSLTTGVGVVTGAADEDWFAIDGCSGRLAASAQPAAEGPNLDLRLSVVDAAGGVRANSAPTTTRVLTNVSGLGASVNVALTGGPFYLVVAGSGSGQTWANGGYDAYGSTGHYYLTVDGCGTALRPMSGITQPPGDPGTPVTLAPTVRAPGTMARPLVRRGAAGGRPTIRVRWSRPSRTGGAPVTRYRLKAHKIDHRGRVVAKRKLKTSASTHRTSWRLPRGRWKVRVQARNSAGWSTPSRASARVFPR